MRIGHRSRWLVVACLCFPLFSRAQSPQNLNVVSVRELSIPLKARDAFNKGADLLLRKQAARAVPYFQSAVAVFANYYEAYHEMEIADFELLRITDSERAFRMSIEVSGGRYPLALFGLGAVLDYEGKFAEAEGVTRTGLDLDPTSSSGHYFLGRALFGLNRLEEAKKCAREVLRQNSDNTEALRLLVDIHFREKDYSAALKDLDEYLKLDPDSSIGVKAKAVRETVQRALVESRSTMALTQPQP